jgi:hypothetical protein
VFVLLAAFIFVIFFPEKKKKVMLMFSLRKWVRLQFDRVNDAIG